MRSLNRRSGLRVVALLLGLLVAAPLWAGSVFAAPTTVSAANTVLEWEATSPDGADVFLDGTASSEDAVMFAWWEDCPALPCEGGVHIVKDSPTAVTATVLLPIGFHEITLWAADAGGEWAAATPITVTVTEAPPVPPVAEAGADQSVPATSNDGAEVSLDGSASTGALEYEWALPGGGTATGATPEPVLLPIGVHLITLTVTGEGDLQDTDTVTVTVNPVADAGDDQTLDATTVDGAEVTLDGTGSFGDTLVWSTAENPTLAEGATPAAVLLPIGIHEITLTATGPDSLSATDTVTVTVNPVADAGDDQTVIVGEGGTADVILDGSGSIGDLTTIVWTTEDAIEIGTGATATVPLPVGVHEITLTITGPDSVADTDVVTITVNEPPLVNPGATQLVWDATSADGALVTLDGSLSIDDALQFAWWEDCSAVPCPDGIRLTDDGLESEVAEVQLSIGAHEITLWADLPEDGWTAAEPITVIVNPVANAGPDQVVRSTNGTDAEVILDGSGSIGDLDSLVWTTEDTTEIATGATPTVTLPVGVHEITLTISGPDDVSDTDTVTITVVVLEADAGEDQTVDAESDDGAVVTLDGSGSTATNTTIVSWEWSTDEDPDLATGETATVTLPFGTTTVTLTVTDENGFTDTDTVDVTVVVPVANAGLDQTVPATSAAGAEVTLDGSASLGDIVTWEWSTDEDPDLATGETATVTLPLGVHEVTLTVTDSSAGTDTDTVTITVEVPTGDATATVEPVRGIVNTTVAYAISLFPPEIEVQIEWERTSGSIIDLGTVQTDVIGNAEGQLTVPATPGGDNLIHFIAGATTATAGYEVAPRVKVIPGTVQPGQVVDVSLRGFGRQEEVLIRWRVDGSWVPLDTVMTSNTGSANVDVIVPLNADLGPNSVRGDGTVFRAQTNAVEVVAAPGPPTATVEPTRGTVNTTLNYEISNFPANATVEITWQRMSGSLIDLGTVETDSAGAATDSFRVPATPGGADQVIRFSTGALSATALYEVAPRIRVLDAGAPGDEVEVSLRGFAKQETVLIRWRVDGVWVAVGTVTTSNTGSANIMVTIPDDAAPGNNSVRGDGPLFSAQTNVAVVTE
ncbi:MAG: PKD domain-containing protein [Thermomicrobiales bacterium]